MLRQHDALLTLLVLTAAPAVAYANPCVLEYVAGRNVYAPAPQEDIFMVREEIRFDLRAYRKWVKYEGWRGREPVMDGEVRIAYEFNNHGAAREVVIGFPIGRENGYFHPFGDVISHFHVTGVGSGKMRSTADDSGLALERASLDICEKFRSGGPEGPQPTYVWYVWPQSFQPGMNKIVVRYRLGLESSESGADADLSLSYILKTTASWGDGKIGRLDIFFSQRGLGGRWKVRHGPGQPNVINRPRRLQWRLDEVAPEEDLRLDFKPSGDESN